MNVQYKQKLFLDNQPTDLCNGNAGFTWMYKQEWLILLS